ATLKTAYVLAFFSFSVFAQSITILTTRTFYALKDTMTPVKISLVTIFLNVLISVIFVLGLKLGVWSVALAFSITSFIDAGALIYFLNKKVGGFGKKALLVPFVKISYAAAVMGATLYIPMKLLDQFVFDTTRTLNLLILTGIASVCGMATYLLFTWVLKVREIELFYKLIRKLNFKRIKEVSTPIV
ncbi:polysaccharide biosynthesis C-terminal domain-containing protein, partial [bacterium]|nr:polysaccharide biosynthesis C-terminal domain-containing protein [bacterium]